MQVNSRFENTPTGSKAVLSIMYLLSYKGMGKWVMGSIVLRVMSRNALPL